jgi:RNA polymerase sigma-70 factor (ECF subfamily)
LPSPKKCSEQFDQLIELSQTRVYRLALRITRNTEDAADVQQETLLKAHRKVGQFEGRARFTTWISRIAINEALMFLRKRRSAVFLPLEEAMPPDEETLAGDNFQSGIEGPEVAYSRKELRELLVRAIESLRPTCRVVFLLRIIEHLSTSETAQALHISTSTVKTRTRKAWAELRDYLRNVQVVPTDGVTKTFSEGQSSSVGRDGQQRRGVSTTKRAIRAAKMANSAQIPVP